MDYSVNNTKLQFVHMEESVFYIEHGEMARTWRIELASPGAQVKITKDQHPHVALQDAIWMGLSQSSLLNAYEHYNGTGFGNATKADVRNFENPRA